MVATRAWPNAELVTMAQGLCNKHGIEMDPDKESLSQNTLWLKSLKYQEFEPRKTGLMVKLVKVFKILTDK